MLGQDSCSLPWWQKYAGGMFVTILLPAYFREKYAGGIAPLQKNSFSFWETEANLVIGLSISAPPYWLMDGPLGCHATSPSFYPFPSSTFDSSENQITFIQKPTENLRNRGGRHYPKISSRPCIPDCHIDVEGTFSFQPAPSKTPLQHSHVPFWTYLASSCLHLGPS